MFSAGHEISFCIDPDTKSVIDDVLINSALITLLIIPRSSFCLCILTSVFAGCTFASISFGGNLMDKLTTGYLPIGKKPLYALVMLCVIFRFSTGRPFIDILIYLFRN